MPCTHTHTHTHTRTRAHTHTHTHTHTQAVDKETEDGIRDACVSLRESLDSLTQQTGSLSLARRVMSKTLHSRVTSATPPSSDDVEWVGEDDFLTLQVPCMCVC